MSAARAIAALVCAALLCGLAAPSAAVSNQEERDLGRRFDMMARQQLPLVSDPRVVELVEGIGNKIVAGLDDKVFDYHFAVVRDPSINAFAVPGGYIYVHDGLVVSAANEDEIAAVLAHEVAHVHAHHMVRQQEKTQLLSYASMLAMLAAVLRPEVAALAAAADQAARLKYSRDFEQEADLLGVRYLKSAGYDSRAMLDFFKKLEDQSRLQPTIVPPYLQTHPLSTERLNQIEAVLRTQQWSRHERSPPSFALVRAQALSRAQAGPAHDVLEQYRRQLEQDPKDGLRNYLFGLVALETGSLNDAATALSAARDAGMEPAERELGRLALRRRDAPEAISLLRAHLVREPGDAGAVLDLATALEASGALDEARTFYRRSFELEPDLAAAHKGYGVLAGRAGDEGDGYLHLATAARLDGNYAISLEQFERAQSLLPAGDARRGETAREIEVLRDYLKETGASSRR
jgi:predicted Zn-dependent protease